MPLDHIQSGTDHAYLPKKLMAASDFSTLDARSMQIDEDFVEEHMTASS